MTPPRKTAWDAALKIVDRLRDGGHTALLAGGCVRDMLLGRTPKDYDVATDATPERIRAIFPRARGVGAKFGVMLVRLHGHQVEVATFRTDGHYSDGRHPDAVVFGNDLDDALRRDFTINGLFFDPRAQRVIDHVDGRADLEAGVIRTIGSPQQRFAEDHLRMLRAIRLSARLAFEIEPDTMQAIRTLGENLRGISPERVWQELEQMLTEPARVQAWSLLLDSGLRDFLVEEWPPHPERDDLAGRRLGHLGDSTISASLALAGVLCDLPPAAVRDICRALRLSNGLTDATHWLVASLPLAHREQELSLADLKTLMAEPHWPDLLGLLRADLLTHGQALTPFERLSRRAAAIPPDAVAPPPLLIGNDLHDLGLEAGPAFGRILNAVYRAQLNEEIHHRAQALAIARRMMADG